MRAAVIGLGRIGFEFSLDPKRQQPASHLECCLELSEISNVAVCDVSIDKHARARKRFPQVDSAFESYLEMLREFEPEIVSVATPTPSHARIACDVASYPSVKAIFLEKPIAQSLEEADRIISACRKNEVQLTVNYTRRWHPTFQKLVAYVGDPHVVIGIHPGPLLRTGTHMIDLFNQLLPDEPVSVQAFGLPYLNYLTDSKEGCNDLSISGCVHYTVKNDLKGEAILISGADKPYVLFELDVLMKNGRFRVVDNGGRLEFYEPEPSNMYSLNELVPREITSYRRVRRQTPLLWAIKSVIAGVDKPWWQEASSLAARKALHVALALHYSTMHDSQIVLLEAVPEKYMVNSY